MKRAAPFLAAVLLLAGSRLGAKSAAPTDRFEESTRVVSIEVPVTVIGRDGAPVRGLTPDDFEVFDDNVRQEISSFRVVDLESLAADPASALAAASTLPSAQRRHFLFLFDLTFSNPTATLRARLAARKFALESLHPTDLAAVATVSVEHGLRLVVTFTPDRAQLARGIDTLGYQNYNGVAQRIDPLRFVIPSGLSFLDGENEGGGGGGLDTRGIGDQELRDYLGVLAQQAERQDRLYDQSRVLTMAKTMQELGRQLHSVEGRKQVLFFSEGFDSRLLIGRATTAAETDTEALYVWRGDHWRVDNDDRYGNTATQGALNRMIEEFRRAGCVIQAVDIGGLRNDADAGEGQRRNGKESLFVLADGTGGELFEDANDLGGQLARVLRRHGLTYVLTFDRAELANDGAYHRLRVKANLPNGARLSHRAGYYAPRPFRDLDPLEKSLLASDGIASGADAGAIDIDLLAASFRGAGGRAYVPVIVEVPGSQLLAGQNGSRLGVEIYIYASNARGEMRDFLTQVVNLDLQPLRAVLARTGFKYYGHLELEPGEHQVRVLVRNAETGRSGAASVGLEVPAYAPGEPALLPPFFLESAGEWVMVRERDEAPTQATVVYPFTVNGEPYVPAARPEVRANGKARLCLVVYNWNGERPALDASVLDLGGAAVDGGRVSLVERTVTGIGGLDKLLADFEPAGLERGEYTLQVAVFDPSSGRRETSSIPIAVVE
jgi:VWFA-related protein